MKLLIDHFILISSTRLPRVVAESKLKIGNSDFKETKIAMSLTNVSIMNASSVLTDSDLQPVVDALQKQVDNDFGPAWGVDAR